MSRYERVGVVLMRVLVFVAFALGVILAVLEWESLDIVAKVFTPLAVVFLALLAFAAFAWRFSPSSQPSLVVIGPEPAAPRPSFSREIALTAIAVLLLGLTLLNLSYRGLLSSLLAEPLMFLALAGVPLVLFAWAVASSVRRWRGCARARELVQELRLLGGAAVLPEEVECEVGTVELLEYNYLRARGRLARAVKGGFKPIARRKGRAVEFPNAAFFIAVSGDEGFLRAPAVRLLTGRYKGLYILLLEPGGAARSAAVDGARATYRSSPGGAFLELEWDGKGGVSASALLRVAVSDPFKEYIEVARAHLREPSSTRIAVAWRGAKLLVLPELGVDSVRRTLGVRRVFAGDPAGAPAELEVAVYKFAGKESRAVPLGLGGEGVVNLSV